MRLEKEIKEIPTLATKGFKPRDSIKRDMEAQEVIEKLFRGNKQRFLRRLAKYYYKDLLFSTFIKKNLKNPKFKVGFRWLKKQTPWPRHQVNIVNILRVLVKYYGEEFDKKGFQRAYLVWELMDNNEISDYFRKKWSKKVEHGRLSIPTKKKALAEQKARGFIDINDFEDFNKNAAHVYSNVDRDLIYPMNFSHGVFAKEYHTSIYTGQYCVGVRGHTRTEIPL